MSAILTVCSGEYAEHIFRDTEACRVSKQDAMNLFLGEFESDFDSRHIWNWRLKLSLDERLEKLESPQYKQMKEKALAEYSKELEKLLKEKNVFSIIEYGDEAGEFFSELEHEIMPEVDFVISRFSHH